VKRAWLLLFIATVAGAQTKQGEQIFAMNCSIGYCHGSRGGVGGAPRLVSRGFSREFIVDTVTRGVPGTAMPSFAKTLSPADLNAVVAYVGSLNGLSTGSVSAAKPKPLTAEAERGRALFYDAVRSFNRCATCHEINGVGIPVAAPIATTPADARALKSLQTPRVATATLQGESMPALVVSRGKVRTVFFDLTTAPPVQRTVDSADVQVTEGSTWKHASAIATYTDADLTAITTYLKVATQ
jgi:mono/diheme cytochrome c family protein